MDNLRFDDLDAILSKLDDKTRAQTMLVCRRFLTCTWIKFNPQGRQLRDVRFRRGGVGLVHHMLSDIPEDALFQPKPLSPTSLRRNINYIEPFLDDGEIVRDAIDRWRRMDGDEVAWMVERSAYILHGAGYTTIFGLANESVLAIRYGSTL